MSIQEMTQGLFATEFVIVATMETGELEMSRVSSLDMIPATVNYWRRIGIHPFQIEITTVYIDADGKEF